MAGGHEELVAGGDHWVTIERACTLWGVSRRTLYNWMADARVRWATNPGGRRYVHLDDLMLRVANSGERLAVERKPDNAKPFLELS